MDPVAETPHQAPEQAAEVESGAPASQSDTESTGHASPPGPLPRTFLHTRNASSAYNSSSSTILEAQAQMSRTGAAGSSHHHHHHQFDWRSDSDAAVSFELPHFSTVSLLTVWVVDCAVGLFSLVLCDVYADQSPEFPLTVFMALGAHLNLLAGVFVYLLGREQYGARVYRFYQPFAGGVRFVTLQCLGVTCVAASLLLTAAYGLLFDPAKSHPRGFLSMSGALALFGNLLVLLSLRSFSYYDRTKAAASLSCTRTTRTGAAFLADGGVSTLLRFLRRRPNAESALEMAMLTAQSTLSVSAIRFPGLQKSVFRVNLAITLACGALSLLFVGHRRSLGFVSFRLLMHRTFDTVLLWLSRLLYLVAVFANVLLLLHADERAVRSSSIVAVQGLSVVSCVALLMFVRMIRYEAVAKTPNVPSSVFELGGVVAVATVFVLGCLNAGIFFYTQTYPDGLAEVVEGTTWTYHDVLVLVSQLAQLVSLMPTPMVYVSGVIMHDERFRLLASNRPVETLPVLLLQAVSFLLYVAAVFSFMLFVSSSALAIASLEAVLSVLSVFCMTGAVRLYSTMMLRGPTFLAATGGEPATGADDDTTTAAAARPQASATTAQAQVGPEYTSLSSPLLKNATEALKRGGGGGGRGGVGFPEILHPDGAASPEVGGGVAEELANFAYIMNGEMIVSYLLCLTNVVLRLLIDVSLHNVWGAVELPRTRLLTIANLCFVACVPLAHYSAKDKGVQVFHPFSGSGSFVALQVLGWMIYATFTIVIIFGTILVRNAQSMPVEWHTLVEQQPVPYTLFGLLELIPVVLITLSIVTEARHTLTTALQQRLARESFLELRRILRAGVANTSDEEKAVTQLAFRTLMTAALRSFDIPCTDTLLRIYKDPTARSARRSRAGRHQQGRSADAKSSTSSTSSSSSHSSDGETREGAEDVDSGDWVDSGDDMTTRRRRCEGARVIVILLCCASAAFFVIAAFMAQLVVLSLAFAVTAMLICTTSCVGVHAGYGMILHSQSRVYAPFMPFRGGSLFVMRQMAGWGCYAGAFLVTLVTSIEEAEVSATAMLIAALLSVASQIFIFTSIPLFSDSREGPTFLETNGEGIVALLTFAAAVAFGRVYTSVVTFFGRDTDDQLHRYLHYADPSGSARRTRVPFVLAVMSLSMAVPCTLIALSRTKRQWERAMRTRATTTAAKQEHRFSKREHQRSFLTTGVSNLLEVLVILLGTITPLSIAFFVFYFFTHFTPRLVQAVESYVPICIALTALTLALSVVPYVVNVGVPPFAVAVRVTVVTGMLYGLPVLAGSVLFLPALLVPRHSTLFLAGGTVVATTVGSFKQVRLAIRVAVYAVIGYLTYQKGVLYLTVGPSWQLARALGVHGLDCALLGVWLWYIPLYNGKPFHNGSQRSMWFTEFARNYLFSDAVKYFNFRIIVDDPAVQMRDDTTQYLFSFHPHGVFPGTALFASLTAEWALKIGLNARRYVSTHVASIIFNVPLVRDFNLRLGALSVSRRTLEASLKRGNSVLIVTGGQAEMLHTQVSAQRMTLITQHTGFVRLAIESRVPLVPLLCFAENNVLGLLQFPRIQRISLKILGFPFPMIPYGRFGLPLPFPTPLTLVVGPPLAIPADADGNNPDDVRRLSEAYFHSLKELFYRRRAEAGYPDMELVLINDREEALKRKQAREAATAAAAASGTSETEKKSA
ncbi:diacylglycerol acyltransferase [Novymonas esmeraldas]|uniref:Diacylglycerol acyltransferase n=1 Tax=Novymonas esmeraldas TaxID=1808958 RepID=A0AAW0ER82_9TRYP